MDVSGLESDPSAQAGETVGGGLEEPERDLSQVVPVGMLVGRKGTTFVKAASPPGVVCCVLHPACSVKAPDQPVGQILSLLV